MPNFFQSLGIRIPIIQAPMAGVDSVELAVAVTKAGGLGSLACALLSPDEVRDAWERIVLQTSAPVNLNFFCHPQIEDNEKQQEKWKRKLAPYYEEFGLDINVVHLSANRAPFDESFCKVIEEIRPPIVSFHFGLPASDFVARVKRTGAVIMSSATTMEEALWLENNGCDVIIAQGVEAGGHRGTFMFAGIGHQPKMADLLTSIIDNVSIPVVAAGGIADAKGIRSALTHGAAGVQLGTAYLFCPEARVSPLYRRALESNWETALTNIFSGRPARGIVNRFIKEVGPISADAPNFPYASRLVYPLRQASEKSGSVSFMQMWSGTNRIPHTMDAGTLTTKLYQQLIDLT